MAVGGEVVDNGRNLLLKRIYGTDVTAVSKFGAGSGTTTPTVSDTGIETRIPLDTISLTTVDACDADTGWAHTGIASAEAVNTTSGEYKEGTGCLNLPTSGAAGTATYSKTVTSFDINDTGDTLFVWFYIDSQSDLTTASDAVSIILGTGGYTNTHNWDFADTAISDGWNLLICKNGSHSGTSGTGATLTGVDSARISVQLDTDQTTNDMRMDYWHLAQEADFFLAFESGYPTYDTTNKRATVRGRIPSTKVNGYFLTEAAEFNTDSTKQMFSHDVHTAITKSSKDEVIYEWIHEVTDST